MKRKGPPKLKAPKMIKQVLAVHRKTEEEYEALMATLPSHLSTFTSLESTPALTEDRLAYLDSKIRHTRSPLNPETLMAAFAPFAGTRHNQHLLTVFLGKLRHLFAVVYTEHPLRVHAEIAHNLKVNLADVLVVERLLVKKFHGDKDAPSIITETADTEETIHLPFPSVVLLVVWVLTTPLPTLAVILHTTLPSDDEHGTPPTFGRKLAAAVTIPEWPTIKTWAGSLSILLNFPLWFPAFPDAVTMPPSLPLKIPSERACVPFIFAEVDTSDPREEEVVAELIAQHSRAASPVKKKGDRRQGPRASGKVSTPRSPTAAEESRQFPLETPDYKLRWFAKPAQNHAVFNINALVPAQPTANAKVWETPVGVTVTLHEVVEEEAEGVLMEARAREYQSRMGGAAASVALQALRTPQNATAVFAPFAMMAREKEADEDSNTSVRLAKSLGSPVRSTAALRRRRMSTESALSEVDWGEPTAEWFGSALGGTAWNPPQPTFTMSASARSLATSTDRSDDDRASTWSRPKSSAPVETDETDSIMQGFAHAVKVYVATVDETTKRLRGRLLSRLHEPFCCSRHILEELRYFCLWDHSLICKQCMRERYAGKTVVSIPNHCAVEMVRLGKKEKQLQSLVQAAMDVAKDVPIDKDALHRHVDDEIDSIVSALNERRSSLHLDIDRRKQREVQAIEREIRLCEGERQTLDTAFQVLEGLARGDPGVVPRDHPMGKVLRQEATYDDFWSMADVRLHRPLGITTGLQLTLPVDELRKSADRLDWSVPKKYLARRMYPPPNAPCEVIPDNGTPLTTSPPPSRLTTTRGNVLPVTLAVLRTDFSVVVDMVESTVWRRQLGALFARHRDAVEDIVAQQDRPFEPPYHTVYQEFKRLWDSAVQELQLRGHFLNHPPPANHEDTVVFPEDLPHHVALDTAKASESFHCFLEFVHDYGEVYLVCADKQ